MTKKRRTKHPVYRRKLSFGQKAADVLTDFAGSWAFIILLAIFMVFWTSLNIIEVVFKPWDPYPFILLNLFLSMLAAIQAPIILMSQNRQTQRDRLRAEYDFKVNKKAEAEIQDMQSDLDKLIKLNLEDHKIHRRIYNKLNKKRKN